MEETLFEEYKSKLNANIKARKEPDFSWNETIAKLGGYYGETNE